MKLSYCLALLAFSIFSATSFAVQLPKSTDDVLSLRLSEEIEKELAGAPSCFKGKVKEKFDYMRESYGGRFGESHNLELMRIFETGYRAPAKYCAHFLDKDLNVLPEDADESSIVYRECINTDTSMSIAGVTFDASTSGTIEKEGLIFSVRYDVTNDLIVNYDAPYFPEESEIKSWKTTEVLECTIIE